MKTYSGQLREESPDYQVDEKLLLLEREESPGSNSGKEGTVSNNDVLDRYGYGRYQYMVGLCCALSRTAAFSHIFLGTAVVSNQNVYWKLSILEDRMVYTVLAVFCLVGGVLAGKLADIHGRKRILLLGTVLSGVAMTIGAITPHYYLFIVCNILAGAAIGANLVVSTCLYAECIPNSHRSYAVVTLDGFTCLINLIVCVITYLFFQDSGWRWHYGLIAIPNALSFFFSFFLVDESPRYFGLVGHTEGQLYVLARIRSWNRPLLPGRFDVNLRSTVITERGSWKGLIFRFFGATLATMSVGFMISAVITMVTFSSPIMIAADYCSLGQVLHLRQSDLWDESDNFEYVLLSIIYISLVAGSILAHYTLVKKKSRAVSLYLLFILLLLTFIPQMQCFKTGLLLFSALVTMVIVGAILQIQTLLIIELFPTYVRGAAFGVVYAAAFLGTLYGPYVDILIGAGSLKSVYAVFFVLSGTTAVLINRGISETQNNKIFDNRDDVFGILES